VVGDTRLISEIKIGTRHRKDMGDLDGLAESMRLCGLIQPVAIRPDNVLVAGERRIRAAKKWVMNRDGGDAYDADDSH
jgi:ParB family chromosome partitioning protein